MQNLLGLIEPLNHPSIETHELFHKRTVCRFI